MQDTQEHLLVYSKLVWDNVIVSSELCQDDIYGDVQKQKAVVSVFKQILREKNKLLNYQKHTNSSQRHLPVGLHSHCTDVYDICVFTVNYE